MSSQTPKQPAVPISQGEYSTYHPFMVILTDPMYGGDLVCAELMPSGSNFKFQIFLLSAWILVTLVSYLSNRRIKRVLAEDMILRHMQALTAVLPFFPLLKALSAISIAWVMSYCYEPEISKGTLSFIRYLMLVQITCDTIFWALTYGVLFLFVSGYSIVRFYMDGNVAKQATLFVAAAYLTNSGFNVTMGNSSLNQGLQILMNFQQFVFIVYLIKYFAQNTRLIQRNIRYIKDQQIQLEMELQSTDEYFDTESQDSLISIHGRLDGSTYIPQSPRNQQAATAREAPHDGQQLAPPSPAQGIRLPEPYQVQQLVENPQQNAEVEGIGIGRFMGALLMKRRLLGWVFGCSVLVMVFDFLSLLVLPFQVYFSRDLVVVANNRKTEFFIARELLLLVAFTCIYYLMRLRSGFPEFYSSDVPEDPEQFGLDVDGRGVFGPLADAAPRKLAKIYHLKVKRKKIAAKSCDMESNLSEVVKQWNDPLNISFSNSSASGRDGNEFKNHHLVVVNPTEFKSSTERVARAGRNLGEQVAEERIEERAEMLHRMQLAAREKPKTKR